jgi:hypothetical protein
MESKKEIKTDKQIKTEIDNKEIDNKLLEYYKNAEHISIIPLLKLIYITTNIDLSEQFKLKHSINSKKGKDLIAGELVFSNTKKNYKIYLDIVDKDYDLLDSLNKLQLTDKHLESLNDLDDNIKNPLISVISFMTQACLVIFNKIKDSNTELLEYNLTLDNNTTIFIEYELNKRIGILFK